MKIISVVKFCCQTKKAQDNLELGQHFISNLKFRNFLISKLLLFLSSKAFRFGASESFKRIFIICFEIMCASETTR